MGKEGGREGEEVGGGGREGGSVLSHPKGEEDEKTLPERVTGIEEGGPSSLV